MNRTGSKWNLLKGDECYGEKQSRGRSEMNWREFAKKATCVKGGRRQLSEKDRLESTVMGRAHLGQMEAVSLRLHEQGSREWKPGT